MNKWIYFLPQFAMLFPCCSKNPLCPWTRILSRAVSSAWNSASDSSTFQEPRFSRILPWFLDPGSGLHLDIYAASSSMRSGLWLQLFSLRIPQAVQAPAGLLRYFFAKLWNEFADIVAVGKIRIYSHFPERKPLAVGENGTSSMLCPCSMELPPLLRLALPWNKYSGSRKVGFLY